MTTEPRRDTPEDGAQYARRMDHESSVLYMDCLFSVLAASQDTGGRFGLMEMVVPKGREPSRHLHYTDHPASNSIQHLQPEVLRIRSHAETFP